MCNTNSTGAFRGRPSYRSVDNGRWPTTNASDFDREEVAGPTARRYAPRRRGILR